MSSMAWKPYQPSSSQPWDLRRVKHLHRRAAFGPTWSELQRDLSDGPEQSVTRLLAGKARIEGLREDFDEIAEIIGDAAAGSNDPNRLKAWWIFRMLFSPDVLREKLTLLWHNHFAASNLKIKNLMLMQRQNRLLRQHATGNFGDMLHAMLRDPAMLNWLDANSNRKGHPNENLARELMELFTLGIGNYTEDDVKEAARALTGWTVKGDQARFREDRHDGDAKTILGKTNDFSQDDLVSLLLDQAATSRRLAWRLCDMFMGEDVVEPAAIVELASSLNEHDLDLGWAVETILRSELFFADANIGSRVSSPIEYVLGAVRSLALIDHPPSTLILAEWCARLGQDLFYPPNVGGWKGGRSWLTSRTIVGRANFGAALVAGELRSPTEPPRLRELVADCGISNEPVAASEFFTCLLLSDPSTELPESETENLQQLVARLLSCPQAQLT